MKKFNVKSKNWLWYDINNYTTIISTEYQHEDDDTKELDIYFTVTKIKGSNPDTAAYITLLNTKDFNEFKNFTKELVGDKVFKEYWDKESF